MKEPSQTMISRRVVVASTLALVVGLLLVAAIPILRKEREGEAYSCAAAFAAATTDERAFRVYTGSHDWQVLTAAEVDALTSEMHFYNCSVPLWRVLVRRPRGAGPYLDPWNERFQMAIRREERRDKISGFHVIVWSKGPDRQSGTPDDVVAPYGDERPRQSEEMKKR